MLRNHHDHDFPGAFAANRQALRNLATDARLPSTRTPVLGRRNHCTASGLVVQGRPSEQQSLWAQRREKKRNGSSDLDDAIDLTHMLHVWNIYQHLTHKSPSFVGKDTSTMVRIWVMNS